MLCPNCRQNQANSHPSLGVLVCDDCQERRSTLSKPSLQVEFTTETIKEQRKEYAKSILQPWRAGVPSKEFADAFPSQAKQLFKDKKPEYVWKEAKGYQNLKYGK